MTETEFIESAFRMVGMLSNRTNAPHTFSNGIALCTAETHVLAVVGEHKKIAAVQLAEVLGVTKGAISQTVKKLEAKGLVEREIVDMGRIQSVLKLTDTGKEICEEHQKNHIEIMRELYGYMDSFPKDTRDILAQFVAEAEKAVERLTKE